MNDLLFYILFNSISVIARRLEGDNERLCCAVEKMKKLQRFPPMGWLKPETPTSLGRFPPMGWLKPETPTSEGQ